MHELVKCNLEDHLYSRLHDFLHHYGHGLIVRQLDLAHIDSVLDVACGLGEWALEMAFAYPTLQIAGIDHNAQHMRYARAYARVMGLENIAFQPGDMFHLPLADGTYDLVHGRFLFSSVAAQKKQALLAELARVCAPGGTLLFVEFLYPDTNSPAISQWGSLFRQMLEHRGIAPYAPRNFAALLYAAGCRSVQHVDTVIALKYGTRAHKTLCARASELMSFIKPFFLHAQVTTAAQFDLLSKQIMLDLLHPDFDGEWTITTVIALK